MKYGAMLWSLHEEMEKDLEGTLQAVSRSGYQGVEFAGYFGRSALELRALLAYNGLEAVGSHLPYRQFQNDFAQTLRDIKALGLQSVTITALPYGHGAPADFEKIGDALNELSRKLDEHGIFCGYQNHDFEFLPMQGVMGADIIMERTQGSPFFLELETFWAEVCSVNSAAYLRSHVGRMRNIHIKDLWKEKPVQSTVLGEGVLPLGEICKAAGESRTEWLLVKQEHSQGRNMLACMAQNSVFMHNLLAELKS